MLVWVNEIVKAKNEKLFISENGWLISRKFEASNRFPFGEWINFWGGPTDVLPNFGPCGFCIFSTRLTINLVYAVRNMVVSCSLRAPAMSFRMWKDKETTRKWQATYEYLIQFRHLFRSVFVRFAIFFLCYWFCTVVLLVFYLLVALPLVIYHRHHRQFAQSPHDTVLLMWTGAIRIIKFHIRNYDEGCGRNVRRSTTHTKNSKWNALRDANIRLNWLWFGHWWRFEGIGSPPLFTNKLTDGSMLSGKFRATTLK